MTTQRQLTPDQEDALRQLDEQLEQSIKNLFSTLETVDKHLNAQRAKRGLPPLPKLLNVDKR